MHSELFEGMGAIPLLKGDQSADARSLNQIATLAVRRNDEIRFVASGPEAQQAVAAFQKLAEEHFGEDIHSCSTELNENDTEKAESLEGAVTGLAASDGIAFGQVMHYHFGIPELPERKSKGESVEWQNFTAALDATIIELQQLYQKNLDSVGSEAASIFDAHSVLLDDQELQESVHHSISNGLCAEQAWVNAVNTLVELYRSSEVEYTRQRASDIIDIGRRLLTHLLEHGLPALEINSPVILLANDLAPSDTVNLDPDKVLGICLTGGGKTSHSAILARLLGIPSIVKAENGIKQTCDGQKVILDGFKGHLWIDASEKKRAELELKRNSWLGQLTADNQSSL
ncbi:PEP-utilizing enzyme [Endozoicomonas gorgoniicola]|uniref:PEP-utilizing enzyme n=1 Tax=Endozoicomonas gorgoniicola TaxID=1234144 RepID=A0ABT3MU87_9GAMM|nr:phosphoenolpyruvate-utilizing N-terminal domain-containing protein [Endozoicomonas gorgoniicola]MCW7552643.1 PEP-utilizing enzyme [Endozoicomonas gorgoniicola]